MESKKVTDLLEKYFEGQTTLQEEQQLRTYFSSAEPLPEKLRPYAPFFKYTHQAQQTTVRGNSPHQSYRAFWAVAASFLVLISITFLSQVNYSTAEIEDAQVAYMQFKDGLDLVSRNLNKGTSTISYIDYFEKSTNKIFK